MFTTFILDEIIILLSVSVFFIIGFHFNWASLGLPQSMTAKRVSLVCYPFLIIIIMHWFTYKKIGLMIAKQNTINTTAAIIIIITIKSIRL